MYEYINDHIVNCIRGRKVGIFGTGQKAYIAESILETLGIKEYVYFDNDRKKQNFQNNIMNPVQISREYFIFISTIHFESIKIQLNSLGLNEMDDYIWALDLDYYDAMLRYQNERKVPDLTFADLQDLENLLNRYIEVREIDWFSEKEFQSFENKLGFEKIYNKSRNQRYRRKIMEYYCVTKLLNLENWNRKDIYVDIGAADSPFAKWLRENKEMNAFAVDLSEGVYHELPYYIKEDATNMHFQNSEVAGISMQSAFEMFAGSADIRFVKEASRVLKKGGRVVIAPLYLHKYYLSTVSPNYYQRGMADEKSMECIRTDCRGNLSFARFYNVDALNERILKPAAEYGLTALIYALPQNLVEKDQFVYLKFILVLEK